MTSPWQRVRILSFVLVVSAQLASNASAFDLPPDFENVQVLGQLHEPDELAFSPDGRMFIGERVSGDLRVALHDPQTGSWTLEAAPFHTFDTPRNASGEPEARNSAGLRGIAFDPDFETNGYLYAFYMNGNTLQNRVVRLRADPDEPNLADPVFGEEVLIDLPFNASAASGSHNGGALAFGDDGMLYITTGDGWEGIDAGDPVQSLSTFTGKILRIETDGTIPSSNPFFSQASGDYRAIFALGLRNPFSISKDPATGTLYVNDARGSEKDRVYIVAPGANFGHEGSSSGIGSPTSLWATAADAGGELITGGAWYPIGGPFPAIYHGGYFATLWGSNSANRGQINLIDSAQNPVVRAFEENVGLSTDPPVKPVKPAIGPDGNLYYLLTTYQTSGGTVQRVAYTGIPTVATPIFEPADGHFEDPVLISMSTTTPGTTIHYSLDGTDPDAFSPIYSTLVLLSQSTQAKAIAVLEGLNPSSIGSASFTVGAAPPNLPPVVDAGRDKIVFADSTVSLDGSGTTDPDGDEDLLTGELWVQLGGAPLEIDDATEEIAFVTPSEVGRYEFELTVSDGQDSGSDRVVIDVVQPSVCLLSGPIALYDFDEGTGSTIADGSGVAPPLDLSIQSGVTSWLSGGGLAIASQSTIRSAGPATKLTLRTRASGEFTLEVWLDPANIVQGGPARIVSLSGSTLLRNFTLGQGQFGAQAPDVFDVRLRTSDPSNDANGQPSMTTAEGTARRALTHLVYTRSSSGLTTLYLDGVVVETASVPGDLANWDADYPLSLANEVGGGRAWLGELHRFSYSDCSWSSEDAGGRFSAGPNSVIPLPEPGAFAMLAIGGLALVFGARRETGEHGSKTSKKRRRRTI